MRHLPRPNTTSNLRIASPALRTCGAKALRRRIIAPPLRSCLEPPRLRLVRRRFRIGGNLGGGGRFSKGGPSSTLASPLTGTIHQDARIVRAAISIAGSSLSLKCGTVWYHGAIRKPLSRLGLTLSRQNFTVCSKLLSAL